MSFTKVDELIRADHSALIEEDNCIFLREYKASAGFKGETNSLIWNLKKKPSERLTKAGWHHKGRCIKQVSKEFADALNPKWLDHATLVPTPGSKAIGHPDYDDRMEQICRGIRPSLDVRCLVKQIASMEASHTAEGGNRASVEELLANYQIDEALSLPLPTAIGIFDDVLTVGRHYRAMHTVLSQRFPGVPITGIFVARTIHPNPFENIDFAADF
ncbi:hypothetical protein OEW28_16510 [Defluviimonas sp. WL0002]|uniref:Uncharacterized protein n=1 Tax=Albidovulum marisflavi TaxID=2984159 RepID=A0ABT2ZGI0_9RHOB|nr:hypothetical protein [Defluviimonas sp. WL0002]MCV2870230.1 hypothetical protein [Defluviimonas sp. WL0002]